MLIVMHPTYTLTVEIQDREATRAVLGQFYNGLTGETGCDKIIALVKKSLADAGLKDVSVTLSRFEHKN
jgi:hypothetical protein